MSRERELSAYVQKYDQKLFCKKIQEGKLAIFRESHYWETFALNEQDTINVLRLTPHFVFALTDNWKKDGEAVPWGKDKIWERLHKVDLWKRDIVGEMEKQEDKRAESLERDRQNQTEAFLHDFHGQFKKTFSDTRVANFEKKDLRRTNEKRIKQ